MIFGTSIISQSPATVGSPYALRAAVRKLENKSVQRSFSMYRKMQLTGIRQARSLTHWHIYQATSISPTHCGAGCTEGTRRYHPGYADWGQSKRHCRCRSSLWQNR